MENASKALIIAGAILLSILIIGLGVFIFNQANASLKKVNLNQNEIQNFNEPFLQYAGENITGTNVMALCDKVKSHNLANVEDKTRMVHIRTSEAKDPEAADEDEGKLQEPTTVKKTIRAGYNYKVTVGYDKDTGLITNIGIVRRQS